MTDSYSSVPPEDKSMQFCTRNFASALNMLPFTEKGPKIQAHKKGELEK